MCPEAQDPTGLLLHSVEDVQYMRISNRDQTAVYR
jgi:hypothetical protein